MEKELPGHLGDSLEPVQFSDISPQGQVRLLDLAYACIVYGVNLIPVVAAPFVLWLHRIKADAHGMMVWALGVLATAMLVRIQPA